MGSPQAEDSSTGCVGAESRKVGLWATSRKAREVAHPQLFLCAQIGATRLLPISKLQIPPSGRNDKLDASKIAVAANLLIQRGKRGNGKCEENHDFID